MLNEATVIERAIRWYAIAKVAQKEVHNNSAVSFGKASAYMDVLSLPWEKVCGDQCRVNLMEYATKLANAFMMVNDDRICLASYLDEHVKLNYWEHL